MIAKEDTCSVCGQVRPMYNVRKKLCGYCWKKSKVHTWKANSTIKRTPLKKVNKKTSAKINADVKFYNSIWNDSNHYCENCNIYLGEQLNKSYISHILSKGAYPKHRHNNENINVLCFNCHQLWEFGDKTKMSIYRKNVKVMNKLKKL
jgi:predicted restriction endonuclease